MTPTQAQARQDSCEGEMCPGCPSQLNPHLQAVCIESRCNVFDSEDDPVRDCSADTDCEVRTPDCCGCSSFADPFALIAINGDRHDDYVAARCPEFSTIACEPCDPAFPGDVAAACDQGKCVTVLPSP